MPPPADPISTLSLAEPQLACLATFTSVIPYLAKKPFSWAMIKGAASTIGMYPNVILVLSIPSTLFSLAPALTEVAAGAAPPPAVAPPPALAPGSGGFPKQPLSSIELTADAPAVTINFRLENCSENFVIV